MTRLGPRIALDVDDELAAYLAAELARHWPRARLQRGATAAAVDLRVVDHEPAGTPSAPTLWLAGIERSRALVELGPGYWRAAMPTTPTQLCHLLECCLGAAPPAGRAPGSAT